MEVIIYNIKDLPNDERPREKLIKYGVKSLSTAELIAVLFRSGTRDMSAIGLANKIISHFKDGLKNISVEEFMSIKGVGIAKATSLVAALELSSRLNYVSNKVKITSPDIVYEVIKDRLENLNVENFMVVILNTKNEVVKIKLLTKGTINNVIVHPREVFNIAIRSMANSIIIAHNHPTGDSTPSKEDVIITKRLIEVSKIIGIELLDHIIVGNNNYCSLKEKGYFT